MYRSDSYIFMDFHFAIFVCTDIRTQIRHSRAFENTKCQNVKRGWR